MKRGSVIRRVLVAASCLCMAFGLWAQAQDIAISKADEFIQLLQKGDYDGAYQRVDSNLGFKTNAQKWQQVWQQLVTKAGPFVKMKQAKMEQKGGYFIVTQVAEFQKGHVDIKVALDNSMRVADFAFANHKGAAPDASAGAGGGSPSPQTSSAAQPTAADQASKAPAGQQGSSPSPTASSASPN
ncbi:MAG: DUF3887 domain-containing protein [Acidobacteriota bacterium]